MQALIGNLGDTTIILISHDASVVRFADVVYELAGGILTSVRSRSALAASVPADVLSD
jgi:ABC-type lipoprotein export system ATPase subunit